LAEVAVDVRVTAVTLVILAVRGALLNRVAFFLHLDDSTQSGGGRPWVVYHDDSATASLGRGVLCGS
jgi:hypothetical protein